VLVRMERRNAARRWGEMEEGTTAAAAADLEGIDCEGDCVVEMKCNYW